MDTRVEDSTEVTFEPLSEEELTKIATTASHESLTTAFSKLELPKDRPLSAIDMSVFEFANPLSRAKKQRYWNEKNRPGWYQAKKAKLASKRPTRESIKVADDSVGSEGGLTEVA
jgi:hypothetical protein